MITAASLAHALDHLASDLATAGFWLGLGIAVGLLCIALALNNR